jgi:hypothetical protein
VSFVTHLPHPDFATALPDPIIRVCRDSMARYNSRRFAVRDLYEGREER